MIILEPRVAETSTSTGTGNFTLGGALPTCRTFSSAVGLNALFAYTIVPVDTNGAPTGSNYEIGFGYLSAATTLVRAYVLRSSASNAAVNFGAGNKQVYLVEAREWLYNVQDDFDGGALIANELGNILGLKDWGISSNNVGTHTFQDGITSHPGVARLTTNSTSGSFVSLYKANTPTAAGLVVPNDVLLLTAVVRIPTITSVAFSFGLGQNASLANFGTAGAFISFDPSLSANFQIVTRQASTETRTTSSLAVAAGTWYALSLLHSGSSISYFANNTLLGTITTNLPTTSCQIAFRVANTAAGARSLDIDHFAVWYKPFSRV